MGDLAEIFTCSYMAISSFSFFLFFSLVDSSYIDV